MITLTKRFLTIMIIFIATTFAVSCTTQPKNENQEHGEIMDEQEHMDGHDHSADDGQHMMEDGETMADTTAMEHEMH